MARKKKVTGARRSLQPWIDARKRYRLSDAQVQMARELGMNPAKLGKLDNHDQEPWKLPLPQFIEACYLKSFGRERPERVISLEARIKELDRKAAARKEAKRLRRAAEQAPPPPAELDADPVPF
ncbi:MAG: hypothetical protein M9894_28980 [Planctomycetes bacterium]|nr:hypothetical protein [Planctomycetota bacterium]